jgi:DNA polymerase bacteriophage-type
MKLWLDIESRSSVPIKRGIMAYRQDVRVIMAQWAIDDGEVVVEDLTGGIAASDALIAAAEAADEIWAHGAEFEQQVLETTTWWPLVEPTKWRCTMALARMHGLPGALEKLSAILKLGDDGKDASGKALIQLFCVPKHDGTYNDRRSHPKEWAEFLRYGGMDITSMRVVHRKLPKWNATPAFWRVWHLDQAINRRGIGVDLKLCKGAVASTTRAKRRLADRTEDMTLGIVERTTQRDRLLAYMADYGVDLPDLTADTVERRLEDESLPEHIKELLRIRQQASKASTAKYNRIITHAVNGSLHNMLVFCGAMRTGRWAGRVVQPHNLPRPKHERWEIEAAIEAFHADAAELLDPNDVLGLASSCLRGVFVARPGRKLCVADLANIEGRDMAWIAGEDWKLRAFGAYDRKEGPDLYKLAYARPFGVDPNDIGDDDWRRQIGKVMELALQYYGGVGAFCSMAETYGLNLDEMAATAWPVIPERVKQQAREMMVKAKKRRRMYGLAENVWLVCMSLVIMWRAAHPAIVKFWFDLDDAVKLAVRVEGRPIQVGRVTVDRRMNWLRVRLPSGRFLCYPAPQIDLEDGHTSFVGVNPYTKQWGRISTYSGKLAENIVQASSADILMDGMVAAEAAGYRPVLSVHDEIVCEPPDSPEFDDKGLSRIMVSNSPWAAGMPLAAKGFTAQRYRK